jgi:hypothetical protein
MYKSNNMLGAFLRVFGAKGLYGLGVRFSRSADEQRAIAQFLEVNGFRSDPRARAIAANSSLRTLPRGLQRTTFESIWQALEKLQAAVESLLHRKLTEDEVTDLWQAGAANLQVIADRIDRSSKK